MYADVDTVTALCASIKSRRLITSELSARASVRVSAVIAVSKLTVIVKVSWVSKAKSPMGIAPMEVRRNAPFDPPPYPASTKSSSITRVIVKADTPRATVIGILSTVSNKIPACGYCTQRVVPTTLRTLTVNVGV